MERCTAELFSHLTTEIPELALTFPSDNLLPVERRSFSDFNAHPRSRLDLIVPTLHMPIASSCSWSSRNVNQLSTGRGSSDGKVDAKSGISVVRWLYSCAVQLSSTHSGIEPIYEIRRWDRKQHEYVNVPCPAVVKEYIRNMGGVDLFDMFIALYTELTIVALNGIDVSFCGHWMLLINGWLLYRRHANQLSKPKKEQMHLVDFTASQFSTC